MSDSELPVSQKHISDLPNELLLAIFEKLRSEDVLGKVRYVCKRWSSICRTFGVKKIDVDNRVPTNTLMEWIRASPKLLHFKATNRGDLPFIFNSLSENCTDLNILEVYNEVDAFRGYAIEDMVLRNLLIRCRNLRTFKIDRQAWAENIDFREAYGPPTTENFGFDLVYEAPCWYGAEVRVKLNLDIFFIWKKFRYYESERDNGRAPTDADGNPIFYEIDPVHVCCFVQRDEE